MSTEAERLSASIAKRPYVRAAINDAADTRQDGEISDLQINLTATDVNVAANVAAIAANDIDIGNLDGTGANPAGLALRVGSVFPLYHAKADALRHTGLAEDLTVGGTEYSAPLHEPALFKGTLAGMGELVPHSHLS